MRALTMADSFASEAFTLLSLGIVIIGCRVAARIRMVGVRKLDFDDYLMCFVAVRSTSVEIRAIRPRPETDSVVISRSFTPSKQ